MTHFEDFVRAAGPDLVRFARAVTGDSHRGEDAAQSALARVLPRWSRIGQMDDPVAYVRKMIINGELSWRRRLSSREVVVDDVPAPSAATADFTEAAVRRQALLQRVRLLPARQRAAVALRFYEDLPDSEIATLLGCTESTVRSLVAAGLSTLRKDEQAPAGREAVAHDADRR